MLLVDAVSMSLLDQLRDAAIALLEADHFDLAQDVIGIAGEVKARMDRETVAEEPATEPAPAEEE